MKNKLKNVTTEITNTMRGRNLLNQDSGGGIKDRIPSFPIETISGSWFGR